MLYQPHIQHPATKHDKYDFFEVLERTHLLILMSEIVQSKLLTCSFKLGWAIVEKAM
jgi:hypothetical protein